LIENRLLPLQKRIAFLLACLGLLFDLSLLLCAATFPNPVLRPIAASMRTPTRLNIVVAKLKF
jgi:hypothetical protein